MLTHIGYQQVSVPQCHPRLQCRVSPLGTAAQGSRWGCRMTPGHRANRRSLTLVCSWEAFHRQLRVTAPSLCSMHCKAAPTAPPAPTSSTVFPPAWHQASRSAALGCKGTSTRLRWSSYVNSPRFTRPLATKALQRSRQSGSRQDSIVCPHNHSGCGITDKLFRSPGGNTNHSF